MILARTDSTPKRWFMFRKGEHHYVIEYVLTYRGVVAASRAAFKMALFTKDAGLQVADAAQIMWELERELAKYEQLKRAA
jgi:hypothetical protein